MRSTCCLLVENLAHTHTEGKKKISCVELSGGGFSNKISPVIDCNLNETFAEGSVTVHCQIHATADSRICGERLSTRIGLSQKMGAF